MNEQTVRLIEDLASKLGTTSEYLWNVLIRQAPIDSITSIFRIIGVVVFGIVLVKLHLKFSVRDTHNYGIYDATIYDRNRGVAIIMSISVCIFVILTIASLFEIPSIVNGLANPEYWALKEIIRSIK